MPQGYVITKWTEDDGLIVQLSHPDKLKVDLDDMMRIFYAHITGAGEAGNVLVRLEKANSNVSSYFTGMESANPYMVNLILDLGEDPEMFGEAVIREINMKILELLEEEGTNVSKAYDINEKLKEYLKNSLFLLERLKNMSKEQRLAQIYSSKKGKAILDVLHERAHSRRELQDKLQDRLNTIISNLEITLDPFIKTNVIKQDWVEGINDIYLFLQSDFTVMRVPPQIIVNAALKNKPNPDVAEKYLEESRNFFKDYKTTEEDSLGIALDLINPDKYDFISLFRNNCYPVNKIPKSSGEGVVDIKTILESLKKNNIITIIKDNAGIDWVLLLADISVDTFYPEYLIELIRQDRSKGKIKKEVAIKHLELLEKAYVK